MATRESTTIPILLSVASVCTALPFIVRALLPDDPDFAFMGLGLGCGALAAVVISMKVPVVTPGSAGSTPQYASGLVGSSLGALEAVEMKDPWVARMTPLVALEIVAALVFVLFGVVPRADSGLPISMLAFFTLAPGLGIVPYLTLRIRRPFAAVVFTAFIVASIKLASCVAVRFVYGPTALEDGYMAGDWQTAKLMISLFWIGTLALSVVLAVACRRLLLRTQFQTLA